MAAGRTRLTEAKILNWADAHRARTGRWPTVRSGRARGAGGLDWSSIDDHLQYGGYGLAGGSSLVGLLAKHRGVGRRYTKPRLTVKQILQWADEHYRRVNKWPNRRSGPVRGARSQTWSAIDAALHKGKRGFAPGGSLAKLLAKHRGVAYRDQKRRYTVRDILAWADAHHRHHGKWPAKRSGPIDGVEGETWEMVNGALRDGLRGVVSKSNSLAELLAKHRGKRHPGLPPRLTVKQILKWADAHRAWTGDWPTLRSGPIPGAAGETWNRVDDALRHGGRGLPKGGSLARLLAKRRGRRNPMEMPKLTIGKILEWADAHHDRTGSWPTSYSGPVRGQKHETWNAIDSVIRVAGRGLRHRVTLAQLLAKHRNASRGRTRTRVSVGRILAWADAHFERTGAWPTAGTGPVPEAPGEVWSMLDRVLRVGGRGLEGGSSLSDILRQHRNVNRRASPAPR